MAPEVTVKTENNREDAFAVRTKVFVSELHFQNEFDDLDNIAQYVTIYVDGECAATGRLNPSQKGEDTFMFGRIAVLKKYRRHHLGTAVLSALEATAAEQGGKRAILQARKPSVSFYESCGYKDCGLPVVFDETAQYYWMEKCL